MTTPTPSAEAHALRALLLLLVEVQNIVREQAEEKPESGERVALLIGTHARVERLVESSHARETIQLARAALETPTAPANRKTFYGIVTQYDMNESRRNSRPNRADGPILMEQYLRDECRDRAAAEALAARHKEAYGWCVVATITVDFPPAPAAAIPAAAASTHE